MLVLIAMTIRWRGVQRGLGGPDPRSVARVMGGSAVVAPCQGGELVAMVAVERRTRGVGAVGGKCGGERVKRSPVQWNVSIGD